MRSNFQQRLPVLAAALLGAALGCALPASSRADAGSGGDDAVTYRTNSAHTAQATMPEFSLPLKRLWTRSFDGPASYALIASHRVYVFVTASDSGTAQRTGLFALDQATGRTIWGPVHVPASFSGMAYDNGRIFIVGTINNFPITAALLAYGADQGGLLYSTALYGSFTYRNAPTPYGGVIYASGGGTPNAVRESDGDVRWFTGDTETEDGSIAVSSAGIFISGAGGNTFSINPKNGDLLWSARTGEEGGGGFTCASYGSSVFVRDYYNPPSFDLGAELDAATGNLEQTFPDTGPQAFDNGLMFAVTYSGSLAATRLSDFSTAWSFTDTVNKPVTAPTVVNGIVYVGTSMGNLLGYDETTGKRKVIVRLIAQPSPTVDSSTDLSAGDGIIAVPCGDSLVAVGNPPTQAR